MPRRTRSSSVQKHSLGNEESSREVVQVTGYAPETKGQYFSEDGLEIEGTDLNLEQVSP